MYLGILEQNKTKFDLTTILHLPGNDFTDNSQYNHLVENVNSVVLDQDGFKIEQKNNRYLEIESNSVFNLEEKYWCLEFELFLPNYNSSNAFIFNIYNNSSDYSIDIEILGFNNSLYGNFLIIKNSGATQKNTFSRVLPNRDYENEYQKFKIEFKKSDDTNFNILEFYYNNISMGSRILDGSFYPSTAKPAIGKEIFNSSQNPFYIKNLKLIRQL